MILINRYYSETTPESVEIGECSDSGCIVQDDECTFTELVKLMRSHPYTSQSPATASTWMWLGAGYNTEDYTTGTDREETLHYSRNNHEKNEKYWLWALKAAGIV